MNTFKKLLLTMLFMVGTMAIFKVDSFANDIADMKKQWYEKLGYKVIPVIHFS